MERNSFINNNISNNNGDILSIIGNINLLIHSFQNYKDEVNRYKLLVNQLEDELKKKNEIIQQLKDDYNSLNEKNCEIEFYRELIQIFESEFIEFVKEKQKLKKEIASINETINNYRILPLENIEKENSNNNNR